MYGLNGIVCDSLGHTTAFIPRFCFLFDWLGDVFVVVLFCHDGGFILFLNFNFGKRLQEQRGEARGWENV